MPRYARTGAHARPAEQSSAGLCSRDDKPNHPTLEPNPQFSLEVTTLRDPYSIQSSQADGVWRVFPVGYWTPSVKRSSGLISH